MDTAQKRKKIDRQFKIDAVNLVVNGQRKVSDVAFDLGIEANMLHPRRRKGLIECIHPPTGLDVAMPMLSCCPCGRGAAETVDPKSRCAEQDELKKECLNSTATLV